MNKEDAIKEVNVFASHLKVKGIFHPQKAN